MVDTSNRSVPVAWPLIKLAPAHIGVRQLFTSKRRRKKKKQIGSRWWMPRVFFWSKWMGKHQRYGAMVDINGGY